jgi:GMP synthase-like glutamine amidotransferase
MTRRLKALIVQHEEPTPPGLLGNWLARRNAQVEVLRIDLEERVPEPRRYDVIALLGSELPAFDDAVPFIPRESGLIREAMEADVPMLGLCFGGQIMARALGGRSFRAARSEVGWFRVHPLPVSIDLDVDDEDELVFAQRRRFT